MAYLVIIWQIVKLIWKLICTSITNRTWLKKFATNCYVKENAWLDLTSSWSIKDLERNCKTFPEARSASSYKLFIWVIMDTATEDPRTKANVFSVPQYDSHNWRIMRDLHVFTIKDMIKGEKESKKSRNWKQRHAQSKAIMESDSTDSADDKPTKSVGEKESEALQSLNRNQLRRNWSLL